MTDDHMAYYLRMTYLLGAKTVLFSVPLGEQTCEEALRAFIEQTGLSYEAIKKVEMIGLCEDVPLDQPPHHKKKRAL